MTDAEKQELNEMLQKACDSVGEHFDSVRIFATKHDGDKTLAITKCNGNLYAAIGQVIEWVDADRARTQWGERPAALD